MVRARRGSGRTSEEREILDARRCLFDETQLPAEEWA
jgi:hypothetical protein